MDILPRDFISDHERVQTVLHVEHATAAPTSPIHPHLRRSDLHAPCETDFDEWLQELLADAADEEELAAFAYGRSFPSVTHTKQVYVDGSCLRQASNTAAAGAGIFWGPGNPGNKGVRVPGDQTNNRAELFAVLTVLAETPIDIPLDFRTDSMYVIEMIVTQGPSLAQRGWNCANNDLLRAIQHQIRRRPVTVQFHHVHGHTGNLSNEDADRLAKAGA
ncbi:ribonuclease H-like domain-containing protein, partial [Mycena pura]